MTLNGLRQIVDDAGFSPRDATVTAVGTLVERDGAPALEITGLKVIWPLARDPKEPQAYDAAAERVKENPRGAVEVVGVIPAIRNAQQPDRLVVKSISTIAPSAETR